MNKRVQEVSGMKRGPMLTALLIGAFVAFLNENLLANALPGLMREFNVAAATIQWLSTGYMLVIGVLVPVTALLQQWFTTRQMFMSAMALFLAGTCLCAVSPGFGILLMGRVVQACGTGLLIPLMMNTILALYPPERRGAAMGLMGLVIMVAPVIGPALSGLIIDTFHWRWLFYMVIPVALFSIIYAFIYLKNVTELTKPRVDLVSIVMSTVGFGCVTYGFSQTSVSLEPEGYGSIAIGSLFLLLLVWRQFMIKEPLIDLSVFRHPTFSLVAVLIVILMMVLFATTTLLPFYMQDVMKLTAFATGLLLIPGNILNGILMPVSGKLFDKFGPRLVIVPGLFLIAISLWLFAGIDSDTTQGSVLLGHVLLFLGMSFVVMPAQTAGLNQLPRHLVPHGTAIYNTLQQIAGGIGIALFVGIMSSGANRYLHHSLDPTAMHEKTQSMVFGLQTVFWIEFILAILILVLGWFIKKSPEHN
ncbi:MFS transporter, DHA2 family, lincomycin resistance protein [Paenibacillus sophorae]|uniref:DHA2 family efflux MFS transporter permease subunit n=1 Tax=Paenibacillus sophorae TaxID=1333845 RepID=A0A1H8TH22_9BACL|nr:MDR family MFS transporter [Paenibacillus sophorae]QWU16200.1 DHA2 family efflux MFS transporter permease subunit [Paenibacillus sophorae]SEO90222.1 MFS transporter, DHA2 family, lincomycin resistance protein [Paenibacillus sophorae]